MECSLSENVNGRNGIASIIQVKAASTLEDVMYAANAECPFFGGQYLRHTTFAKESMIQDGGFTDITNETTVHYAIDNHDVDMVGNLFLRVDLPRVEEHKWINAVGHAIVKEIKLIVGDYELVTYSGNYLHIKFHTDTTASHFVGRSKMIGQYNSRFSLTNDAKTCYIEIPFLKSAVDQQYLPLFMSKRNPLFVTVTFRSVSELVVKNTESPDVGVGMRINEITEKVYV